MKLNAAISIVWFRQDLRLSDQPVLLAGAQAGRVLPIYIFDDCSPGGYALGNASKLWLHHALDRLDQSLNQHLNIYQGTASAIIEQLIALYPVKQVLWNRCYEPWHIEQEQAVQAVCEKSKVHYEAMHGNYLWQPQAVLKSDRSYYKVFTAYKNKALTLPVPPVEAKPAKLDLIKDTQLAISVSDLGLRAEHPWCESIEAAWQFGEEAAEARLETFITEQLAGYAQGRNYPAKSQTSRLSPYLHWGQMSPAQIWGMVHELGPSYASQADIDTFLSEVIWREFSCYLLYHFKALHYQNFREKFDRFPWKDSPALLQAWQQGRTGIPLVDAGMRELWQTGYMHNRVRMIAASFLVKNLGIHWHHGRDWFWDCLVDADLANNSASWQWVAGSGVDAAPFFRIFNPVTQGEKFDPEGEYIRRYVPELQALPDRYLFKPWLAPKEVLASAGVILGQTYPRPIVDLAASREQALEANRHTAR